MAERSTLKWLSAASKRRRNTMKIIGEFLGLDEDTQLLAYFRRYYAHYFPNLMRVHRTTFTRQAADLWKVKERL